jgi:hypothetical protein
MTMILLASLFKEREKYSIFGRVKGHVFAFALGQLDLFSGTVYSTGLDGGNGYKTEGENNL